MEYEQEIIVVVSSAKVSLSASR